LRAKDAADFLQHGAERKGLDEHARRAKRPSAFCRRVAERRCHRDDGNGAIARQLLNLGGRGRVEVLHQDDGGIRLLENLEPFIGRGSLGHIEVEVIQIPRARAPDTFVLLDDGDCGVPAGRVSGAPPSPWETASIGALRMSTVFLDHRRVSVEAFSVPGQSLTVYQDDRLCLTKPCKCCPHMHGTLRSVAPAAPCLHFPRML